jgi:hypothetical protein
MPSNWPSSQPSTLPSTRPTSNPTIKPTDNPSEVPSSCPSSHPSVFSSEGPTYLPTTHPTNTKSTTFPTSIDSFPPFSYSPSTDPTLRRSSPPSYSPTAVPSDHPNESKFDQSTSLPSNQATSSLQSYQPTEIPTPQQSRFPSFQPISDLPSLPPEFPTSQPSVNPTTQPSMRFSSTPITSSSCEPTFHHSSQPTIQSSNKPETQPDVSAQPNQQNPSEKPTNPPSFSISTLNPTSITESPTQLSPVNDPTRPPSASPLTVATAFPTHSRPSFRPISPSAKTITVFPNGTTKFKMALFAFGAYLPALNSSNMPNVYLTEHQVGSSYIVFGTKERKRTEIVIGSRRSQGLYSAIMKEAGLMQDLAMSRSGLPIGDFNGDTLEDLLMCDTINSRCSIYFSRGNRLSNLEVSASLRSHKNDLFGWSTAKLNDINGDKLDDFAVSALSSNIIYIFFGRTSEVIDDIIVDQQLSSSIGMKMIGSSNDQSIGLALSSAGDFNADGLQTFCLVQFKSTHIRM